MENFLLIFHNDIHIGLIEMHVQTFNGEPSLGLITPNIKKTFKIKGKNCQTRRA